MHSSVRHTGIPKESIVFASSSSIKTFSKRSEEEEEKRKVTLRKVLPESWFGKLVAWHVTIVKMCLLFPAKWR